MGNADKMTVHLCFKSGESQYISQPFPRGDVGIAPYGFCKIILNFQLSIFNFIEEWST